MYRCKRYRKVGTFLCRMSDDFNVYMATNYTLAFPYVLTGLCNVVPLLHLCEPSSPSSIHQSLRLQSILVWFMSYDSDASSELIA